MRLILQKPIFWVAFLIFITAFFLFLTFLVTNNKSSTAKKPGSCLILEEKFCSQVKREKIMINNSERTYIIFQNTSDKKVPVFAAEDGESLDKVPESGTPFTGFKVRVTVADGAYIISGDLEVDKTGQTKDPKKGMPITYVTPGGIAHITKTLVTPNGLVTDEIVLKNLFRLK